MGCFPPRPRTRRKIRRWVAAWQSGSAGPAASRDLLQTSLLLPPLSLPSRPPSVCSTFPSAASLPFSLSLQRRPTPDHHHVPCLHFPPRTYPHSTTLSLPSPCSSLPPSAVFPSAFPFSSPLCSFFQFAALPLILLSFSLLLLLLLTH